MGLEREMYEQQRAALEPWRQVGIGALQQLSQLYNIQVPQGTFAQAIQANQPAPQTGPTRRDFSTYLSQNPDLMAEFNKPGVQQMFGGDPAAYAQWHYENFGREEGRQLPGMTANVQTITAAPEQFTGEIQQPAQMEGRIMGLPGDMAMGQQQALPTINAPISTQTAPQPAPEQAAPQQPMGQAPAGSDPRFASFFASPDYQYRLQQGTQNVLANRAAMGGLESGAAMRELQNVGQQEAAAEYGNYFNRLATLAGYGTSAANQQAQAGQNYASAYGINAQNLANLRGETSYQRALASGQTAGTIAGIGQNFLENMNFGGGGAKMNAPMQFGATKPKPGFRT
jgi:hypothetical protein